MKYDPDFAIRGLHFDTSSVCIPFHSIPFHSIPFYFIDYMKGSARTKMTEGFLGLFL